MRRKHWFWIFPALVLLVLALIWPTRHDSTPKLSGAASAGLILSVSEGGTGYYVLAVIDQSRADRAGIHAGDTLLSFCDETISSLTEVDAFFSAQTESCVVHLLRGTQRLSITLPAP